MFAQGEDPDYAWTVTVIGFWLKLLAGLVGGVLSLAWMLQVPHPLHADSAYLPASHACIACRARTLLHFWRL